MGLLGYEMRMARVKWLTAGMDTQTANVEYLRFRASEPMVLFMTEDGTRHEVPSELVVDCYWFDIDG